jgi:hypothetical protein
MRPPPTLATTSHTGKHTTLGLRKGGHKVLTPLSAPFRLLYGRSQKMHANGSAMGVVRTFAAFMLAAVANRIDAPGVLRRTFVEVRSKLADLASVVFVER